MDSDDDALEHMVYDMKYELDEKRRELKYELDEKRRELNLLKKQVHFSISTDQYHIRVPLRSDAEKILEVLATNGYSALHQKADHGYLLHVASKTACVNEEEMYTIMNTLSHFHIIASQRLAPLLEASGQSSPT